MILKLTQRVIVPNKEAQRRIDLAVEAESDEDGLTREQCESLGIPFKSKKSDIIIDEDGFTTLKESDLENLFLPCILKYEEFSWASNEVKLGATIYTKNGDTFSVKETVEEILNQIENGR